MSESVRKAQTCGVMAPMFPSHPAPPLTIPRVLHFIEVHIICFGLLDQQISFCFGHFSLKSIFCSISFQ
jgi:hypothetical protein